MPDRICGLPQPSFVIAASSSSQHFCTASAQLSDQLSCGVQTGPYAAEQQSAHPAEAFCGIPGVADAPVGSACTADLQVDHNTAHLHAAAFSDLHFLYCLVANCNAEYASLIVRYSCVVAQAIDAQTHKRCAGNMDAVYICAFDFLSYLQDLGFCMQCQLLDYFVND